ncbi:hypothetical protein BDZ91DRAFT_648608 [Kalaharituber pfeilii]|nr:hypothetical protein BDZ91DRAFT_648608 [Kalaharituber pfeilii]
MATRPSPVKRQKLLSFSKPNSQRSKQSSSRGSQEVEVNADLDVDKHSNDDDTLDTDTKLAILSSLFPSVSHGDLLEVLISSSGSLETAEAVLQRGPSTYPEKRKKPISSAQSSLTAFLPQSSSTGTVGPHLPIPKPQKGKPLLLFSPGHVSALTPCTLITSFLPPELANQLLRELVHEAESFPEKGSKETRFYLFGGEKEIWSEHTSGFFVRQLDNDMDGKIKNDKRAEWYTYSGQRTRQLRRFTPSMEDVTSMVEEKVNELIRARWAREHPNASALSSASTSAGDEKGKEQTLPLEAGRRENESPYPWSTNAAFVNCYAGGNEVVGWHADQLTYLGPMCTIASISLGVGREFGLKKESDPDSGVIKIWLPHNSLLVMEAGTQEEWKHCIYPACAITRHPISGSKRINITYRCYRESLLPKYTPHCRCPLPGILRAVMDCKSENFGRYFWSCQGAYLGKGENREGCGWFEWAEWAEDGELKGWRECLERERNC